MRPILIGYLALLGCSYSLADDLLFSAVGYPDHPEYHEGRPREGMFYTEFGGPYQVTGMPITLTEPTEITGIYMVGGLASGTWEQYDPQRVNIFGWEGGGLPEVWFGGNPGVGNVYSNTEITFSPERIPFTLDNLERQNYYFGYEFDPIYLDPGEYIFSVTVYSTSGILGASESALDLGSAFKATSIVPGQALLWENSPGFTTGTPAWDIYGRVIPEPGTLSLAAFGALACIRRRSR